MGEIRARGLEKKFGGAPALAGVDLDFPSGLITVLLGPSGCGKTTLLRVLAGLTEPDGGTVEFAGVMLNDPRCRVAAERRGLGMVFQDALLWPHLTVRQNIGFPLPRGERTSGAIEKAAALARVDRFLDRYPGQLSGGERRRAAIARAIVRTPRLLLLDEPLSGLDANLREALLSTVRQIQRTLGVTACYVTHDQEEALGVADRVVVMRKGRVLQVGLPEEIYSRPATSFVAGFVGLSTQFDGDADGQGKATTELGNFPVSAGTRGRVRFAARPENVRLDGGGISGIVVGSRFLGDRWLVTVRVGERNVLASGAESMVAGSSIRVSFDPAPVVVIDDREEV